MSEQTNNLCERCATFERIKPTVEQMLKLGEETMRFLKSISAQVDRELKTRN